MGPFAAVLCAGLLAATPAKIKLLVLPLTGGEGVSEGTARALSATVIGEMRKRTGYTTLSGDEVQALLSVERQRQLLGCIESSCLAELGGALGVDQVVTGSVARLGASYLLHLQLVDARKALVLRGADRRKKGAGIDEVLDEIPAMVTELLGGPAPTLPPLPVHPPQAVEKPVERPLTRTVLPPSGLDELQLLSAAQRAAFQVATDGKGNYLAFVPFAGLDAPLFAGSADQLWAQYLIGGGANGTSQFSLNFWDPRTQGGGEAELDFNEGALTLSCKAQRLAYTRLPAAKERAFLARAKLFTQRWRRQGMALGRDEDGTYYFVDEPRGDGNREDLHLFIGRKGQVVPVKVTDVLREESRVIVETDAGTLTLPTGEDAASRNVPGTFKSPGGTKPVNVLDLWRSRAMIYTTLGAYPGERLGTACDPFLH
jgi:TolB-like protein